MFNKYIEDTTGNEDYMKAWLADESALETFYGLPEYKNFFGGISTAEAN